MNDLQHKLSHALEARADLLTSLHAEQTDCYRLFHGTNEGESGLAVDRYGPQLLVQSFHTSLSDQDIALIEAQCRQVFEPEEVIYNDRSASNSRRSDDSRVLGTEYVGHEMGVKYRVRGKHMGQDPLLFLDMRAGRRRILEITEGKSVLNLFSYTCGVGVCAAKAGASDVVNVDFSTRNLDVGVEDGEGLFKGGARVGEAEVSALEGDALRDEAGKDVIGVEGEASVEGA